MPLLARPRDGRGWALMTVPLMRQLSLIGVSSVCAGVLSWGLSTPISLMCCVRATYLAGMVRVQHITPYSSYSLLGLVPL